MDYYDYGGSVLLLFTHLRRPVGEGKARPTEIGQGRRKGSLFGHRGSLQDSYRVDACDGDRLV